MAETPNALPYEVASRYAQLCHDLPNYGTASIRADHWDHISTSLAG